MTRQTIRLDQLPRIVAGLPATGADYVILDYASFILFVERCAADLPPDVVCILSHKRNRAFVILNTADFIPLFGGLEISGDIDERRYLANHADVAAAVRAGRLTNARAHYILQGYFEQRAAVLC